MERLKALVHKEPPPPEPKKQEQEKQLATAPKQIDIKPDLKMPEKIEPKLASKTGFQTAADPTLVQDKKIALNAGGPALAPLSAQKLGTIEDRATLKSNKGSFQLNQGESISSIGGGPKIADPSAPAIAIRTGANGSKENFSAPAPQAMANKGKFGGGAATGLGDGPKLGFRDSIIARDAAPSAIATSRTGGGAMAGLDPAPAKQDAGKHFQGGLADASNPVGGAGGSGSAVKSAPAVAPLTPAKKKSPSMFTIQGPLKDRKIESKVIPEYPAWAQEQGIQASVVLQFTVNPDGTVKDSIIVRNTSGYPKLDESAMKALRQWKFAPTAGDENREEVGLITFNYSLS
jgi:TonB family protein